MARIIDAFTQFFDDNGDPLVDGWLRFTESGTNNTDKDTFKDSGETIANTNPVQLDGAGRCPSVFGTGSYNVRSFTDDSGSPGVQIQQFDPVGGDAVDGAFSEWISTTIYPDGEIVTASNGKYYRSLMASNQNNDPTISPTQWEEVQLTGAYNSSIEYAIGELVIDDGYLYRSLVASNLNNTPADNPTDWGVAILQTDLSTVTFTHDMTSDADYTLSLAENRDGRAIVTDTGVVLTAARNIIVSDIGRTLFAQNDTAQILTFKTLIGTGIEVGIGDSAHLIVDGTNVIDATPTITTDLLSETFTHDMVSDADYTLADIENRHGRVIITDTGVVLTIPRNIIVADTERLFFVSNDTAQTLTFKTSAGTGIDVLPSGSAQLMSDGTNIINPVPAGALELLEVWVPEAVNSKDFTWDEAAYSDITIVIDNVIPEADDVELRMRYGHSDGGTIITSTYQTRSMDFITLTFSADTNQDYIALTYVDTTLHGVGTAAGESFSSTINLTSTSAGRKAMCKQIASFENAGGASLNSDLWADTSSIDAIDTVRLYWESGNFEVAGKVYVYGLKRT